MLVARISLTLSRHSSLSFIVLGRSSGQHPVCWHSCWMFVRAGRPAFARPCLGVHKSTSLISSSLLPQNTHTRTHTHTHTHTHIYIYILTYIYICKYIYLYMYKHIYIYIYIYVCVCVCVCAHTHVYVWRFCCNGFRRWKWTGWSNFKSWKRLFAFYITLILLEMVCIQLFSLQLCVNCRSHWLFKLSIANYLG